jgi:hypothetical protein
MQQVCFRCNVCALERVVPSSTLQVLPHVLTHVLPHVLPHDHRCGLPDRTKKTTKNKKKKTTYLHAQKNKKHKKRKKRLGRSRSNAFLHHTVRTLVTIISVGHRICVCSAPRGVHFSRRRSGQLDVEGIDYRTHYVRPIVLVIVRSTPCGVFPSYEAEGVCGTDSYQ